MNQYVRFIVVAVSLFIVSGANPAGAASTSPEVKKTTNVTAVKSEAPKVPAAAVKKTVADSLIVIARLIEIPGKMAPNDLYNYVYVMKFRVVSIVKGTYTEKELLAGVYNPLIPRRLITGQNRAIAGGDVEKFIIGSNYRLVLEEPIEKKWKDAVEDEYFDSELTKYLAVSSQNSK